MTRAIRTWAVKKSFLRTLILVEKIICLSEASYDFFHYIIGKKNFRLVADALVISSCHVYFGIKKAQGRKP
jgi:hypothetical protein